MDQDILNDDSLIINDDINDELENMTSFEEYRRIVLNHIGDCLYLRCVNNYSQLCFALNMICLYVCKII